MEAEAGMTIHSSQAIRHCGLFSGFSPQSHRNRPHIMPHVVRLFHTCFDLFLQPTGVSVALLKSLT